MRSSLHVIVVSIGLIGMLLGASRSSAADSPPLEKLRQEKLAAAKERYELAAISFEAGTVPVSDVYAASKCLKDAECEIAATKAERIRALKQHRDRMAKLYKTIHELSVAAKKGGEADKDAAAQFWELQAKIWVLEETTKP